VTDQNGDPVPGAKVDFEVTGANPNAGFGPTQANGQAEFCYTGSSEGLDTIVASVGTIADTATKTWLSETANLSGHKFDDLDGDGPGGSDSPLGGVDILLLARVSGVVVDQTVTNPDGSYTFTDVSPGDYLVCEDLSSMPGRIQTFPTSGELHPLFGICYGLVVAPNQDIDGLDFYNHKATSITIVKDAVPDSSQDFDFTASDPGIGSFRLDDDLDPGLPNSLTFVDLSTGSHIFTETVPSGWKLSQISCDNGPLLSNPDPPAVMIDLQSGQDVVCTFTNEELTAITLLSFTAHPAADQITLAWQTGTEVDNAGFNLQRATAVSGPYTKLNATLIPAKGDAVSGASYTYTDHNVIKGMTYYYKLEDVDTHGVSTFHGPVSATAGTIRSIYLPVIIK
jgi:hypothetical protein